MTMKCLETRDRNGIRYRRYLADDGRVIRTYEVPATVLKGIGMKRVRAELEVWRRGEAMRARQIRMRELIAQGIKPTAIADELGVTEQRVRQMRKAMASSLPDGPGPRLESRHGPKP